ncbi:serine hydrolase [Domibacillus indicus]|uniref:serine hydrolase n=1 Tax=Domibacillus indicus TaxID=1437523 RepID=UPI000617F6FD|nr:serine hydrolase [Domibacillus indicus]
MKVIVWTVAAGLAIVILILFLIHRRFQREIRQASPDAVLQFIEENAADGRAALSVRWNGERLADVNETLRMPLASTVKIMAAVEYARQAADGQIDPNQKVPLETLQSFYVPRTDGGAHTMWLRSLQPAFTGNSVPLSEVAKGMITYSSNANTDYLLHLLGLENVNRIPALFGLEHHEPIYPLVSTLFVPVKLMKEQKLGKKETMQAVKQMELAEYRQRSIAIHEKWLEDPPTRREQKQLYRLMNVPNQKIWSDRLTRSTTSEYASVMEKLNSRTFLPGQVHAFLDPVMEGIMKDPANQEWLLHAGRKGGSTAFVLTEAMYAAKKNGGLLELAFFTDGLTLLEHAKLSGSLNAFELSLLRDEAFRRKTKEVCQQWDKPDS